MEKLAISICDWDLLEMKYGSHCMPASSGYFVHHSFIKTSVIVCVLKYFKHGKLLASYQQV
uniref:Uncharacterized protein n=1 Tax=Arion vulgaris TaxID=1028688 RepID=A0A0B7AEK3_9EUPU